MKVSLKAILVIVLTAICIPVFVGVLMTFSVLPNLPTSNDWIGFFGGYIGSIIGGIITVWVMKVTLTNNKKLQERTDKQNTCQYIAHLIALFCCEMLAYRGRMNYLLREAEKDGEHKPIDQRTKIEIHATTEQARQYYFELDMLFLSVFKHTPEEENAQRILQKIKSIMDNNFPSLSMKDADRVLEDLRTDVGAFLKEYIK